MQRLPYGFRIVGPTWEQRQIIDADAAFLAYASCDPRLDLQREAYLSAFSFGEDFRQHFKATGSERGFSGPCWAPFLWWDIDRADALDVALADARRLAGHVLERFPALDDADLLAFFSGAKGFHIGLPTSLFMPAPSPMFSASARRFAEHVADQAGVKIDSAVYNRARPLRAPNSKHPKTARYKRQLSLEELNGLSLEAVLRLAESPAPFDVPNPARQDAAARALWLGFARHADDAAEQRSNRRATDCDTPSLNRKTLDFIREGASEGERAVRLFSAARNLAEFNCPPALAYALLREAAIDTGLTPKEVVKQIDAALAYRKGISHE